VTRSVALLVLLTVVLAGCFGNSEPTGAAQAPAQSSRSGTDKASGACPITNANGKSPPGEKPAETFYGNGKLWTVLWPKGKVLAGEQDVRPDGSIEIKFPWWAAGVEGGLSIAGRRLDGTAPPVRAQINSGWPETGFSGDAFWASGIIFASEGCWQVTGSVGATRLTFVTLVVKA
jgi:hypothetical protein